MLPLSRAAAVAHYASSNAAPPAQEYVVVGTAFVLEDESEPSEGRIVVMEVVQGPAAGAGSASPAAADAAADDADAAASERRLVMVSEKSSKGAPLPAGAHPVRAACG